MNIFIYLTIALLITLLYLSIPYWNMKKEFKNRIGTKIAIYGWREYGVCGGWCLDDYKLWEEYTTAEKIRILRQEYFLNGERWYLYAPLVAGLILIWPIGIPLWFTMVTIVLIVKFVKGQILNYYSK